MSTNEKSDSDSDDERILIRNGKVDPKWYEHTGIRGYDVNLNAVKKGPVGNKLDQLIRKSQDPNWWKTIRDESNNCEVVLTDAQLELIQRIRRGQLGSKQIAQHNYQVEHERTDPFPVVAPAVSKKQFMPSMHDKIQAKKIMEAIKQGRIKLHREKKEQVFFDVWAGKDQSNRPLPISAPKMRLPDTHQSYNPPQEYLWSAEQEREWQGQHPQDRQLEFVPKKYPNTRSIARYEAFVGQRFERCLELYECPRVKKKRIQVDLDKIMPEMPQPEQLRPFPTCPNIVYNGHGARVRAIACNMDGNFMASGDEQGQLFVWDVITSRKLITTKLEGAVFSIDFSKNLLIIGHGRSVSLLALKHPAESNQECEEHFASAKRNSQINKTGWVFYETETQQYRCGLRMTVEYEHEVSHVRLHHKGDYFLTVCPDESKKSQKIMVHCLSKASSQKPFAKSKGMLQKAYFHPTKPLLVVMTRRSVFVFNLQRQLIHRKMVSGADWNSSLAVHPYGDVLGIGSFDGKVNFFDLELSEKPFKTIRLQEKTIRAVAFHQAYPLFSACCDDGAIHLWHVRVFRDTADHPVIVPLKILRTGHQVVSGLGVLDIKFHPRQPWLFSAGADGKILLWT